MKPLEDCTVLVVDDTESNLDILVDALGDSYDVAVALDGEAALTAVAEDPPDIILLDIMMPGMDGYEVCRRLKSSPATEHIPVVFLTALSEIDNKTRGFGLGAVDYITKPFEVSEVQARVKTHLSLVLTSRELEKQNEILEQKVLERTRELADAQEVTIHCLASLAETRDNETGGHILRTQRYVRLLAEHLRNHPHFRRYLDDATIELLYKTAPLHDIGKVGVPDSILLKPGRLTEEEFEEMKKHTTYGREAIKKAVDLLNFKPGTSFLSLAMDIAYCHHERWDGKGYPCGLAGEEIPIGGRLMALADVYDALVCKRVYKPSFSHVKTVNIIMEGRGTQFDPDVIDAFAELEGSFRSVAHHMADSEEVRDILLADDQ